jgi:hypothetical protein
MKNPEKSNQRIKKTSQPYFFSPENIEKNEKDDKIPSLRSHHPPPSPTSYLLTGTTFETIVLRTKDAWKEAASNALEPAHSGKFCSHTSCISGQGETNTTISIEKLVGAAQQRHLCR